MIKAAISIPSDLLKQFDCIVRGVIESIAKLQQDFREIIPLTMLINYLFHYIIITYMGNTCY